MADARWQHGARIAPRRVEDTPWYLRPFFWNQRRRYGRVLEAGLLWARSPRLFLGVALLYGLIDRRSSPIEPALRSLVTVRVSQINHCRFCIDLNSATLLQRGVSEEKALALAEWWESPLFDARERAVLAYAEAMSLPEHGVAARHMARLRCFLDEDAIVELTALVAFQNLSSKFNAALGVPPQGFCALTPSAAAPPAAPRSHPPDASPP
ncbi:carboxymuconolactone decarboxylase family protein [Geminicoccaceae bacterium 1502E]|nr:carboxymuconolactone decarboxylase family protein [Geminicoccaceae bacterium 1502E]